MITELESTKAEKLKLVENIEMLRIDIKEQLKSPQMHNMSTQYTMAENEQNKILSKIQNLIEETGDDDNQRSKQDLLERLNN